jgi:hypothetical protein
MSNIFSINELMLILKIIDQCENNNVQFEGLDYIIISIAARLIRLDVFKLSDSILKISQTCPCSHQQYFSYIVAVSFIGGGNRSTWRKENHRPVASH